MHHLPVKRLLVWICVLGSIAPVAVSAQTSTLLDPEAVEALRQSLGARLTPAPAPGTTGCVNRTIQCNSTRSANLNTQDCATDDLATIFDFWLFNGVANQQVTINMTSNQVDPFLVLLNPLGGLFDQDDDSGPGLDARIQTTLDQTGQWAIAASGLPGLSQTGTYALSLDCQTLQPQTCVADDDTLCLSNNRFRVEVDWRTNQGTFGAGQAVELTPDTGYFWFFQEENVEMVIKVLDSCVPFDRFWVFAGGLTNVEVNITVTDTQTGEIQNYANPINTPFQPIQDTNAFATCP